MNKTKELMDKIELGDSTFSKGKKSVYFLFISLFCSRTLWILLEFASVGFGAYQDQRTLFTNLAGLFILLVFMYMVVKGNKWWAILPLIGGIVTVWTLIRQGVFSYFFEIMSFSDFSLYYKAYIVICIVSGVWQIISMILILLLPQIEHYCAIVQAVKNGTYEIIEESKNEGEQQ